MALKFLNKKGWHTGSLRNIENVWKAEQKHEAEQKKLEELRKQIQEEKERQEFRLLQEQAGLVPKQERLDFLYESGLAVGKGSDSDGFKSLETLPGTSTAATAPAAEPSSSKEASVPGALFEDKPHSANDAWRKLHSDPLLIIRQREQEALARVKNNPIQMAMIRKRVEGEKHKEKNHDDKGGQKKHRHSKSKHHKDFSSERDFDSGDVSTERRRRKGDHDRSLNHDERSHLEDGRSKKDLKNEKDHRRGLKYDEKTAYDQPDRKTPITDSRDSGKRHRDRSKRDRDSFEGRTNTHANNEKDSRRAGAYESSASENPHESNHKHRKTASKLTEEERAARLLEMQQDAELHEEQRWRRLKKAAEDDAREAKQSAAPSSRNFLDAAQKSMYGTEKGGSSTIEESIRRRTYYSQGRSEIEANAFRR